MSFRAGKDGKFTYAVLLGTRKITGWSVQLPNDIQDTTNGESGGYRECIAGLNDLRFDIQFDYDVGTVPFGLFVQGSTITNIALFVTKIPGGQWLYWDIPTAFVESAENDLDVHGKVSCRARCVASGGSYSFREVTDPS